MAGGNFENVPRDLTFFKRNVLLGIRKQLISDSCRVWQEIDKAGWL
jgi:hypothetical protein